MTPSRVAQRPASPALSLLLRWTALSATVVLAAAALAHLFRTEHAGPIRRPELWLAAITCGAAALFSRAIYRSSDRSPSNRTSAVAWGVTTLALFLWGFSLSFHAGTRADMMAVWLILLAFECCGWLSFWRTSWLTALRSTAPAMAERATPPLAAELSTTARREVHDESESLLRDDHVVQHFTRSRSDENGEFIHGLIRCRFMEGERTQIQHVAFCPPLGMSPSILVDQVEGPAAKVKAAQAETFGARFEIRLNRTCRRSTDVVIEFFASTNETSRACVA